MKTAALATAFAIVLCPRGARAEPLQSETYLGRHYERHARILIRELRKVDGPGDLTGVKDEMLAALTEEGPVLSDELAFLADLFSILADLQLDAGEIEEDGGELFRNHPGVASLFWENGRGESGTDFPFGGVFELARNGKLGKIRMSEGGWKAWDRFWGPRRR